MKNLSWIILPCFFLVFSCQTNAASKAELIKVKQQMIQQSINNYSGSCPCPYNTMKNGRACGKRSAYSRPGGQSPLCFVEDISDREALKFYKKD